MINKNIIAIASNTKYVGLENNYTHKASVKNSLCGDIIKVEIIANKLKVNSMRYETESCILCEASASLLANKIKNTNLKEVKTLKYIFKIKKEKKISFPPKFKEFNKLLNKNSLNRAACVILPIQALLKAFKID